MNHLERLGAKSGTKSAALQSALHIAKTLFTITKEDIAAPKTHALLVAISSFSLFFLLFSVLSVISVV